MCLTGLQLYYIPTGNSSGITDVRQMLTISNVIGESDRFWINQSYQILDM